MSGKKRKETKKFQKPKRCRQLPQHLIYTVFQIFHMENQDNQLLQKGFALIMENNTSEPVSQQEQVQKANTFLLQ